MSIRSTKKWENNERKINATHATKSCRGSQISLESAGLQYPCSICDKYFFQKGNKEGHMRTHTGEKYVTNQVDDQSPVPALAIGKISWNFFLL